MKVQSVPVSLLILLLTFVAPVAAQLLPLPGPERASAQSAGFQSWPVVAAGPGGGFVVVWAAADAEGPAVAGQLFSADGNRVGGELRIADDLADGAVPAAAVARDGSFTVVWRSAAETLEGRRYDHRGEPLTDVFRVAGPAATGRGSFAAVWTAVGGGGASDVGLRRYASPRLELLGGRFVAEVDWKDFAQRRGRGVAVPHSGTSGHFWFFRPQDLDLTVKMVDGRAVNGHFWLYYGATSNVAFTLRITDRVTGRTKTCFGPPGRFVSAGDVLAFPAP